MGPIFLLWFGSAEDEGTTVEDAYVVRFYTAPVRDVFLDVPEREVFVSVPVRTVFRSVE